MKILIAEDDKHTRNALKEIFDTEGYSTVTAADGEAAWNSFVSEKPDIACLDIMMPKLNGIQVLDKLKSDPDTKSIPVVILTNLASEKDAENAMLKGAVKYIIKSQHEPKSVSNMVKEIISAYSRDDVPTAPVA